MFIHNNTANIWPFCCSLYVNKDVQCFFFCVSSIHVSLNQLYRLLLTKYTFMMHATSNRLMVTPSTIDMDYKMYGGDFEDDDMDALEI